MTHKKQWGGRREGAGRPPLPPEKRKRPSKRRIMLYVTQEEVAELNALRGTQSMNAYIRERILAK